MIDTNAIGHMTTEVELHLLEKKRSKESKEYIDIYFGKRDISNQFLWDKWKKILNIRFDDNYSKLLFKAVFLFALKRNDKSMLIPFRHEKISHDHDNNVEGQHYDIYDLFNKNKPTIKLNDLEISEGYKIIEKLNINKNHNVVLLCVRDPAFSHRFNKNKNFYKSTIRDNDINDFKELVRYLCEKNYKVIRIGKIVEKELDFKHENFIDLPFTNLRTDFLDIFLFYICKFVISTGTGSECIGDLFRKKRIWLNFSDFEIYNFKIYTSLIHPKEVFDNDKNYTLSLFEIFDNNLHKLRNIYRYEQKKFSFKSISPDKMINSVKEMENLLSKGYSSESIKKNKIMNDLISQKINTKYSYNWSEEYLNAQKNLEEILFKR